MICEEQGLLFEEAEKSIICGADEAGRGPLAGPVVAAACLLPKDFPLELLNDSKKLTEKQRQEAEKVIKEKAIYAITFISPEEIDRINILQASLKAMAESYLKVNEMVKCDLLLVDGNKLPKLNANMKAIVKGDSKIPEIMAASILAKTARDEYMDQMDELYPNYGFRKHKGYPTAEHYAAIEKWGPTPIHRMSFALTKRNKAKDPDSEEQDTLL